MPDDSDDSSLVTTGAAAPIPTIPSGVNTPIAPSIVQPTPTPVSVPS